MGSSKIDTNKGQKARRIRRPPPPSVELVLAQPEGLEQLENSTSAKVSASDSSAQFTDCDDWASTLQMSAAMNSVLDVSPNLSVAFLGIHDLPANQEYPQAQDETPSEKFSHYLHTNALCCAVDRGSDDMVQCLLCAGADPMTKDANGRTALHYAAERSNTVILNRLVLGPEVDIDVRDFQGRTPLFTAVQRGNIDTVRILLQLGANVYVKDIYGARM
ncbi:ankyrin repeat domain-containing protein [Cordyceps javanica]|uniref:Ankyrin repeat domain-containing protein n=1 Tax=Cordyceps javanica TaxID=43265 RepID=A0A545VCQ6_9HYPO|nr:ankyrin repeat domain-containing protein [Cordyceps javanica]TQW10832.1 ankyrin repeat domain-containing protein [Cordyceps javanica]